MVDDIIFLFFICPFILHTWVKFIPLKFITGKRAVVGYQDGAVKIWDLKSGSVLHHVTGSVCRNYMYKLCHIKLLRDFFWEEEIKLWKFYTVTVGKYIYHIFTAGHLGHSDSITSIDCHTDNTLVLTGSADLTVKLININTGKVSNLELLQILQ